MANVLLIEDKPNVLATIEKALKEKGHDVVAICESEVDPVLKALSMVFDNEEGRFPPKWDFLVFDVNFPANKFAGIDIYNHLVAHDYRNHWEETIVYTRYRLDDGDHDSRSATESGVGPWDVVACFATTAGIPGHHVIPGAVKKEVLANKIVNAIDSVLLLGSTPRCLTCGIPKPKPQEP